MTSQASATKAAPTGGYRGYDGGKRTTGRKKHVLVDTLGLLIVVVVTAACVPDAVGALGVLARISRFDQPRLSNLFVDQAYHRDELYEFARSHLTCTLEVGSRPADAVGFVPIRKRWVVERTFGWFVHSRRLARDYERTYDSSEAQVYISHIQILLKRLTKERGPDFATPGSNAIIPGIAA